MNWYYIDGPKRIGPLTETEWDALVQKGVIQPETQVWNPELPTWIPWGKVPKPAEVPVGMGEELNEDEEDIFSRHARRRLLGEDEPRESEVSVENPLLQSPVEPDAALITALERQALERDYQIRFWPIFKRALDLLKQHLLQLAGATLIIFGLIYIGGTLPIIGILMNFAFSGVLMGGLFSLFIRRMRGVPVEMGEIFSGFRPGYLRHLARKTLLTTAIMTAFFIPAFFAMAFSGLDFKGKEPEELIGVFLALDPFALAFIGFLLFAALLIGFYFTICWVFATPLIRDKAIPYRQAMRLSRLRVLQHPWRISGTLLLTGGCFLLPYFLLSAAQAILGEPLGVIFALGAHLFLLLCLPAMIAVVTALYEEAFGLFVVPRDGELPAREEDAIR